MNGEHQGLKETSQEPERSFALMQQLIEEMDRTNQRLDYMEDRMERPAVASQGNGHFNDLYDDAWRSEESDGASLHDVPITFPIDHTEIVGYEDAVNSAIAEVSKDFLTGQRPPAKHNNSEESQLSSDTDFKLVTGMAYCARYPETAAGLSDTDWNPYGTESDNNVSPHQDSSGQLSESKISWNPPLHSTDYNVVTPFSNNSQCRAASIHDSRDGGISTKTDITADFSTISHASDAELLLSPAKVPRNIGDGYTISELNKTIRAETGTTDTIRNVLWTGDDSQRHASLHEVNSVTGKIMSKESSAISKTSDGFENSQYVSVVERARLMGIPQDILDGKRTTQDSGSFQDLSPDTTRSAGYASEEDPLGQKVEHVLSKTEYLDGRHSEGSSGVDYGTLQRDLQEIQDSLQRTLGPNNGRRDVVGKKKSPPTSDPDIVPSTTTTPERQRRNRMAWDFAGDLGYGDTDNLFREISLDTRTTGSQRHSSDKHGFHSDGEETHTSEGSSSKHDNHAAADQALADMMEILHPLSTGTDVDQMLSNFRDQRRQLETRYEQLNNQGLAEKVNRILSNQDPSSQANGILSEVSAEEKDMKTRYALGLGWKDFNLSGNSKACNDESNASLALPEDVRRRLDLSDVSSVDASRLGEKPSFNMPSKKGFTAFDEMTNFLSSQMAKISERSFNHSVEMRIPPQHIQCYPLFHGQRGGEEDTEKKDVERKNGGQQEKDTESKRETAPMNEKQSRTSSPPDPSSDTENRNNSSPDSQTELTTLPKEKYRPYRPAGSHEIYYTESDTASVADSVTTMESTHIGSDDARGPSLPSSVLGSRADVLNARGIYGNKKQAQGLGELPTIQERSSLGDDKDSESSRSKDTPISKSALRGEGEGGEVVSVRVRTELSDPGIWSSPQGKCSVQGVRREAQWEKRMEEVDRDRESPHFEREAQGEKFSWEQNSSNEKKSSQNNLIESEHSSPHIGENPNLGVRYERDRRSYSLPSDAFVSSGEDVREGYGREELTEPLSLRIKMTFEDDASREVDAGERPDVRRYRDERQNNRIREEDNPRSWAHSDIATIDRERHRTQSPELGLRRSPSPELPRYSDILSDRRSRLDNFSYQPMRSEENMTQALREARVSPAFHRALSPELRSAIESRSPMLSHHIEKSLAQPPAYQTVGDRNRPTFLARERRYHESPEERQQSLSSSTRARAVRAESPVDRALSASNTRPLSPSNTRPLSPVNSTRSPMLSQDKPRSTAWTVPAENSRSRNYDSMHNSKEKAPRSPVPKRCVELTLEGMSSDNEADQEIDKEPVSKRIQLLTQALAEEDREVAEPWNINQAWELFKAGEESQDSSMGSGRMGAVSDLLKNPAQHRVRHYLQERQQYQLERQDRAQRDRFRQQVEHKQLQQLSHSTTEEEPSSLLASQAEGVVKLEADKQRKRNGKKKKGRAQGSNANRQRMTKTPTNNENAPESLFSIAEDSFEHSPGKTPSKRSRSGDKRQQHVIDPNMMKLRDRIQQQRHKIDKGKLKELQRVERVRRLEDLLALKKSGEIGDGTLQKEMEEISTTSSPSQESVCLEHTPLSDDSTTAKDSSTEMHKWKAEKERRIKESRRIAEKAENDRRFSTRGSQIRTKSSSDEEANWELRILRLVRDGQLTPDEAYALAEGRAKEGYGKDIWSVRDSKPEYVFNRKEEKPHRKYKPYMRHQDDTYVRTKHIPKLCIPEDDTNNNRKLQEYRYSSLSFDDRGTENGNNYWTSYMKDHMRDEEPAGMFHISGSYKPRRDHSTSPTRRAKTHSPAGRAVHSRTRSLSPGSMLKRQVPKRGQQHKAPQRKKKMDLGFDTPVRESVAWHIPYDLHPSQWKEPSFQGLVLENYNYPGSVYYKKDQKIKKDGTLFLEDLENENPLAPRMKFTSEEHHNLENLLDQNKFDDGTNLVSQKPSKESQGKPTIFDEEKGQDCPPGIPREEWTQVLSRDVLARKENHWEVDPLKDRVQYILNKPCPTVQESEPTGGSRRPLGTISLQEAFLAQKQNFISHCKERQKRLALAKDNRQMQECLRVEREAIFAEHPRMVPPNLYAHPYSENLYQPKNRIMTKQEMKEMSKNKYNNLPEVLKKKENEVKVQESKLNRLRARLFNKKVQRDALKKPSMRRR